jgi:CubicO group peptidase (beta-lactamase class C family)
MNDVETKLKALEAFAQQAMLEHHVPGVSIGLIIDGVEHYVSLGVTSVANPLPVTADTLFQIASITKTFTASAAMKLVQDGLLELDAPVRTYIPEFRVADEDTSARVTIKNLLMHTGGWLGDFDLDTGDGSDALELYVQAMKELPQITPLNTLMSYSNAAFVLLGRVIEVVTGKTLDVFVRESILEPLQLHDTVYWAHEAITKRTAVGHTLSDDEVIEVNPVWRLPRTLHGGGGIISSAKNLMRYARFQMGQLGDVPINAAARLEMQTPGVSVGGEGRIGLCWFVQDRKTADHRSLREIGHSGSVPGFQSEFWFIPSENFAFTVTNNIETLPGVALNGEIVAWVREHMLNVLSRPPEAIAVTSAQTQAFVGWYTVGTATPDEGIEISRTENTLYMRVHVPSHNIVMPPVPMAIVSETTCVPLEGPLADSPFDFVAENGVLKYVRAGDGGRIATRSDKGSAS